MQTIIPIILLCSFMAIFIANNRTRKKAQETEENLIPDDPKVVFAYLAYKRGEIYKQDLDRIIAESEENKRKEAEVTKAKDIKKLN